MHETLNALNAFSQCCLGVGGGGIKQVSTKRGGLILVKSDSTRTWYREDVSISIA